MSNRSRLLENSLSPVPAIPPFEDLLRNPLIAETFIEEKNTVLEETGWTNWLLAEYARESSVTPEKAYPSQGLIKTVYDEPRGHSLESHALDQAFFNKTVHAWLYYLELLNHPDRLEHLFETSTQPFIPPAAKDTNPIFENAQQNRKAISINQLALHVEKWDEDRTKRTDRFLHGPFVKLGNQARSIFVGSANPDIWGGVPAVATMAQAHSLVGLPRDSYFNDEKRQADFATKAFEWLNQSPLLLGRTPEEQSTLLNTWRKNIMGVLEANPKKVLKRVEALYDRGIRTFRIYSPEPGLGPLQTLELLRNVANKDGWEPIEIFVGQIVAVDQAQAVQSAGADGIYIGIGGGGRCTTGVRSGSAIDWPQLVWASRGHLSIPIIVEGGASDHIAQSLALGVTGIGVSRAAGGGTIESPGGWLYFMDRQGRLFKYYRGEASAGIKALGGRIGPFEMIPYVEGESTIALLEYGPGDVPTISQKIFLLTGDAILALVFQNVETIAQLQDLGADKLVEVSLFEQFLRNTH